MRIETGRLALREMAQSDFPSLCKILQDEAVMYAYEGAFNDEEAQSWLDKQIARYKEYGFGLWAVILKENGIMIGQCGLTMQEYSGHEVLEIGYLFQKSTGITDMRLRRQSPVKNTHLISWAPGKYILLFVIQTFRRKMWRNETA